MSTDARSMLACTSVDYHVEPSLGPGTASSVSGLSSMSPINVASGPAGAPAEGSDDPRLKLADEEPPNAQELGRQEAASHDEAGQIGGAIPGEPPGSFAGADAGQNPGPGLDPPPMATIPSVESALQASLELPAMELREGPHRDEIVKRLRRAEGQLRGIVRMLEAGQGCLSVAQQLTAVRKALDATMTRMTVSYLEQELGDLARQDPSVTPTVEQVGRLISRLS